MSCPIISSPFLMMMQSDGHATLDKLPNTVWFTAPHAIKRTTPHAPTPPAASASAQPDTTAMMNLMASSMSAIANTVAHLQHAPAPTPAPTPATLHSAPLTEPPSSPIPALAQSLTLEEYAEVAEFSPDTMARLQAMNHTPAEKLSKKRKSEWLNAGFGVTGFLHAVKQDRLARDKIRRIDHE